MSRCRKNLCDGALVGTDWLGVFDIAACSGIRGTSSNVSDFAEARAFYGKLGFETMSGFPDTNTLQMAEAIGISVPTEYDGSHGDAAAGYLLHGELIGLGFTGGLIDLIEFKIPRNEAPPYQKLNHLGMARAQMVTTNIRADYNFMLQQEVQFLSAPVTRKNGDQFAIFQDLDGTFYELLQTADDGRESLDAAGDSAAEDTHLQRLGAVVINVTNYERSAAWYGMFGYELLHLLEATESPAVAHAMGFTEPFEIRGGLFRHTKDGSLLEIVEWISPRDTSAPYPIPINHIGIHRIAFSTSDIEGDVEKLRAAGVSLISEITPCCSGEDSWGGIVAFYDPDGTIVELVEQPMMTFMSWILSWFN